MMFNDNNFRAIQDKIEYARKNSPLSSDKVTVLAACKGQGGEAIRAAIAAGIRDFGENRVQEAQAKWPALRREFPSVRLHLIGPLQTNKVKQALELFDVIQTIDRPKLAEAVAKTLADHRIIGSSDHRFYIQVNIGKEPQKAGVMPEEADSLIAECRKLGLPVEGLMCIPPDAQPPGPYFALLREIGLRNGLSGLSMGMSGDYETAVRMGAGCVRLGRILFSGGL